MIQNRHNTAKLIIPGLISAQILFTLFVWLSGKNLYRKLSGLRETGYLIVPSGAAMESLSSVFAAFCGALFFTFTTGALLISLSLSAVWLTRHFPDRKKVIAAISLLLWAACLTALNINGFTPAVTFAFIATPAVVIMTAIKYPPARRLSAVRRREKIHMILWGLLILLWGSQIRSGVFIDIRDSLFLSNPVGIRLNNFYYKYTLYPAQAFKSLNQKTIKTYFPNLDKGSEKTEKSIGRKLCRYDYLPLKFKSDADVEITGSGGNLVFKRHNRTLLETGTAFFTGGTKKILNELSARTDRYRFLRNFTFISLFTGAPFVFFVLVRMLAGIAFSRLPENSFIASSGPVVLSVLIGVMLLIPVAGAGLIRPDESSVRQMLTHHDTAYRVRALRYISENRLEPADFFDMNKMTDSPHIAEKYWLASALGASRKPEAYHALYRMLNDDSPNVSCQALQSLSRLGRLKNRAQTEEVIINKIKTTGHWYIQWYAYRALKRLGWKQCG